MIQCGIDETLSGSCVTDGYHDMGIDAVYNDSTQKKLVLVQSKWRRDGTGGISQEEAGSFAQGVKRIINSEFEGCNAKISAKQTDIIAALKDMDYQIEVIFCHTGNQCITDYSKRPITDLLKQVNEEDVAEILVFKEIKLQDIYDFLASSQALDDITIDDVILSNWGTIDEPFKAYYGSIPASAVGEWYQRYGNRLFAKNIRYYKGSTDVNQGIKEVLRTEPEKFFYYNNGVKLLCRKITRKAAHSTDRITGLFALEGVSLVNGAQTTGSIGAVYADMPDVVARAKVFIQMIDLADTEEEQSSATGRKRLVLVHGNRFLLHMILSEMKQYANYLTAFFDAKSLPELVNPLCQKYWELTFSAMEEKYPDAYPAHIFKNIGRLREIKEQICLRDSKSQEE